MVTNIYLDNNSTTKIDPRVLEEIMPFLTEQYANATSNHKFGTQVQQSVRNSRENIADLIGCENSEIIFTSGATEAINISLKGISESYKSKGKHIVTVVSEHTAVLNTCKYLERIGYALTYLPINKDGLIDLQQLKQSVNKDTILVCVMFVNNEIGTIQPIKEIAEIAHSVGAFFMTDATQAVGKLPININALGIDLMTFSGHKIYGPKGIGALFVRNNVKLHPLIHGGGQEKGVRSGTLNVPGIVGLGKAAEIIKQELNPDLARIEALRNHLETELLKIDSTFLNGSAEKRVFNVSNICFKGILADIFIAGLKNIAVSNGSACVSTLVEPSHVLKAIGLSDEDAFSSIRFSLGRFNTKEEISVTIEEIQKLIGQLRSMQPRN